MVQPGLCLRKKFCEFPWLKKYQVLPSFLPASKPPFIKGDLISKHVSVCETHAELHGKEGPATKSDSKMVGEKWFGSVGKDSE